MTPDPTDPLKIRRTIALFMGLWAAVPFPIAIAVFVCFWGLSESMAKCLIAYQAGLALGPIGAYFYAAQKKQNADTATDDKSRA